MKNAYVVQIHITTPDGRRVAYDMALDRHELVCLEPLPNFPGDPSAAFAAAAQIEARRHLAQRIGQMASANACDVIEAIHAGVEPTREEIEREKTLAMRDLRFARFGVGRY